MAIGDPRLQPLFVVGPGKSAGMSQLQADEQIVGAAELLLMRREQIFTQLGDDRQR